MRRLGTTVLLAACLATTACGGGGSAPAIDDVVASWPADAGPLTPLPSAEQDHYASVFAGSLPGDPEIRLLSLPAPGLGMPWQVMVVRGSAPYTAHDVNDLRCRFLVDLGTQAMMQSDEYDGTDGLHGHDGVFSVDADGVAVLVMGDLTSDEAHAVAKALGGDDDDDRGCTANSGVRIAG